MRKGCGIQRGRTSRAAIAARDNDDVLITPRMLELDNVTLCAIDTRTPVLALEAMQRSMHAVRYHDALLFLGDAEPVSERAASAGVKPVAIPRIDSLQAYSAFMLQELAGWIETDFALIIQWDGFVLNPGCWTSEFLDYDYIGAPWADRPPARAVGNGGFSLRSRRLLRAMSDPAMTISHPEDVSICEVNRDRLERAHGMRFAPVQLAARFSFERVPAAEPTFGFHGAFNLPAVLPPDDIASLARTMTNSMARSPDARQLARALVDAKQYATARRLLVKWMRARSHVAEALALWTRTCLHELNDRVCGRR